jgi:glutathione S-transferase
LRADLTAAQLADHARSLAAALDPLEGALADRPFLAGENFTVADIPLGINTYRWFLLDVERPPVPHIEAWYQRLRARPAFITHVVPPAKVKVELKTD